MTRLGLLAAREHPIVRDGSGEGHSAGSHHRTEDNNNNGSWGGDGGVGVDLGVEDESGGFSESEKAFLRDVRALPEGGIAERYRRLGWSVRQGQHFKESLVRRGLIQEELKTTTRGKMRIVRLTEKAREFLQNAEDAANKAA